jgi:hypothetical protein
VTQIEGLAGAGWQPDQAGASAQLPTKPWDAFYERADMPAAPRANAFAATGGADPEPGGPTSPLPSAQPASTPTAWNRYLAQALRDFGTAPTSAADSRPVDQRWRERIADVLRGEGPFAAAGRSPRVGTSAQPMISQQAADEFYDRVGIPPSARSDTAAASNGGEIGGQRPNGLTTGLSATIPPPSDNLQHAAGRRMSCAEAQLACLNAGYDLERCLNAFVRCLHGQTVIFAPGIVGDPKL